MNVVGIFLHDKQLGQLILAGSETQLDMEILLKYRPQSGKRNLANIDVSKILRTTTF